MARREELDEGVKDRSKKRKAEDEQPQRRQQQERDEDDGKRRDKDKDKHKHKHRKHKHRSHRKHRDKGAEDSVAEMDSNLQKAAACDETEDGEILEPMDGQTVEDLSFEQKDERNDGNGGSSDLEKEGNQLPSPRRSDERKRRSRSRDDSPDRKRESPERRYRGDSLDRKRRSRSRDHVARHRASPERKRRRSRSRDGVVRRGDDRVRRHAHSPERRRRSRSREQEERDRFRRRGDAGYKDDRGRDDERHHRDIKAAVEKVGNVEDEEDQDEYLERVANQLAEQEEDIEKVKEESRKRRQAIMEKYKKQQQAQANASKDSSGATEVPAQVSATEPDSGEGIIDPSTPFTLAKPVLDNGNSLKRNAGGLGEGSPSKSEKPADMFSDIFGESPPELRNVGKGDTLAVDTSGLTDNWDDADGYYTYRVGEVLDNRYEIASAHGRGVFSTVVKARDTKAGRGDFHEVAIKIIRSNETMFKAGQMELVILNKLAGADPENKKHCVRLLSSFEYRNHLCLVFESLHMNLREILKKFGRNIGLSLRAVHSYAFQLFTALKHLRNCGVLHCDIKPDNMLVNEAKNLLRLCDFGSAMFAGENDITPYLVSRFYRAPEIILGLPYDHALDMWSVGCCLYELFTGKVLFPGPTNNDMLRLHMELKGSFPKKMLRKAAFAGQHFDQDFNFHAVEEDPVTKKAVKRLITNFRPKDFSTLISAPDEDPKHLASFKLMLEKIFVLDPEKRLTVSQALDHPFIKPPIDKDKVSGSVHTR